ncbi:electron transfer flavoprotein subunit beta (macronuclear) [Tetrahymena thermophila SB210]|uniref:Electron transfer flavoprotein subunit beta n=1 Tax=Tetrahymena thermophila (strain SB210) TaxID=312017 RepID=I7MJ35_TETTS|nr:electron transfer flavoprotein subunit beta [Tetrahymena thermophila SB210]EAR95771.1 electron transfer flavoprotein subunit beta [Tetrahymena thermophila SB210]|eukprot:XP_001016016.1 electron transfer flavoprotein subunit beta [Tetrahymena thermophila SB210]
MRALVGVKRVLDYTTTKIRVKPDGSGIDLSGKQIINPFCEIAIEEAIKLKEKNIIKEVVALSIGPKTFQETLRHSLAMGADKAIHISTDLSPDQKLQPLIVAKILQKIIERDNFELVLLGKQSVDDDFNQTGQLLAGLLDWPQATFASQITIKDKDVEVTREIDAGLQTIGFKLPGVITCDLRLNTPRYAKIPDIMKAKKKPLEELQLNSLGIDLNTGLEVIKTEAPQQRKGGQVLSSVDELVNKLRNEAKLF